MITNSLIIFLIILISYHLKYKINNIKKENEKFKLIQIYQMKAHHLNFSNIWNIKPPIRNPIFIHGYAYDLRI